MPPAGTAFRGITEYGRDLAGHLLEQGRKPDGPSSINPRPARLYEKEEKLASFMQTSYQKQLWQKRYFDRSCTGADAVRCFSSL